MGPVSGPGPRFPGSGQRDPGDPVPDADPWLRVRKKFILFMWKN